MCQIRILHDNLSAPPIFEFLSWFLNVKQLKLRSKPQYTQFRKLIFSTLLLFVTFFNHFYVFFIFLYRGSYRRRSRSGSERNSVRTVIFIGKSINVLIIHANRKLISIMTLKS